MTQEIIQETIKEIIPRCENFVELAKAGKIDLEAFGKEMIDSLIDCLVPIFSDTEIMGVLMKAMGLMQNQGEKKQKKGTAIKIFSDNYTMMVPKEVAPEPLEKAPPAKRERRKGPRVKVNPMKKMITNILESRAENLEIKHLTLEEVDRDKIFAISIDPSIFPKFFSEAMATNFRKRGPAMDLEGLFPYFMAIFSQKKFGFRNLKYRGEGDDSEPTVRTDEEIEKRSMIMSDVIAVVFKKQVINNLFADAIPILNELFKKYGG